MNDHRDFSKLGLLLSLLSAFAFAPPPPALFAHCCRCDVLDDPERRICSEEGAPISYVEFCPFTTVAECEGHNNEAMGGYLCENGARAFFTVGRCHPL